MSKGPNHRPGAKSGGRNGRTRYERGRHLYDGYPRKNMLKGSRGSVPEEYRFEDLDSRPTLADVWP